MVVVRRPTVDDMANVQPDGAPSSQPSRRRGVPVGAWLGCALIVTAFACVTTLQTEGRAVPIDRVVTQAMARVPQPIVPIGSRVAHWGAPIPSLAIAALLTVLMVCRRMWCAALSVATVFIGTVAVEATLRLRIELVPLNAVPTLLLHPHGHHLVISSYPSGHVARLTLLILIVALQAPHRLRNAVIVVGLLLALLAGVEHSYAFGHSGSDLLGGLLLGCAGGSIYASIRASVERRRKLAAR
jgi:membrane-associated phospholipid phosphatase